MTNSMVIVKENRLSHQKHDLVEEFETLIISCRMSFNAVDMEYSMLMLVFDLI